MTNFANQNFLVIIRFLFAFSDERLFSSWPESYGRFCYYTSFKL